MPAYSSSDTGRSSTTVSAPNLSRLKSGWILIAELIGTFLVWDPVRCVDNSQSALRPAPQTHAQINILVLSILPNLTRPFPGLSPRLHSLWACHDIDYHITALWLWGECCLYAAEALGADMDGAWAWCRLIVTLVKTSGNLDKPIGLRFGNFSIVCILPSLFRSSSVVVEPRVSFGLLI